MKLFIAIFFICLSIIEADPQQDWYKAQLDAHVLPPYGEAFRILRARILNELLTVNVSLLNDDTTVTQLANRLLCAAHDVYNSLEQSIVASDQLRNQIDVKVMTNVVQVGAYQKSITDKQLEITQTDQSLTGVQAALALAEQAVRHKEQSVQTTEQAVRSAEDAVEQARKCHGLLGKRSDDDIPIAARGWFSSITRPIIKPIENAIKDVIIKPVCSVINTGPLDSAKNQRDQAYAALHNARGQVVQYQQSLSNYQIQKLSLEAQLIQIQSNLMAIQTFLKILQDELSVTMNINTQLKKAATQLNSVYVGSSALQTAVTNMIDFDQLLIPLNAIYTAMSTITTMDTSTHVPSDQIEAAKEHLAQIAILIPNIPFNTNTDLTCV